MPASCPRRFSPKIPRWKTRSGTRLEERLKSEVESSRSEYDLASREFRFVAAQGTGLPAPDGNLRVKQIAALHSAALRKYTAAIRRFNTFLTDGKLPGE